MLDGQSPLPISVLRRVWSVYRNRILKRQVSQKEEVFVGHSVFTQRAWRSLEKRKREPRTSSWRLARGAEQRRPKGPRGPIGSRSSVPCGFPRLPAAGGRTPSAQGRGGHSLGPGPARRPPVRRANGSSLPVISLGKGPGGPATGECGNPGFEFPPRRCFRTESPLNALPHVPWASVSPPVKQ
ncbi:uncharacterized protein [Macaca fascicularis]|uniref:uncharacterized protein n=1 Tax=Macaca fascicularis TaxID=9541 RepID=UPI0032B08A14